jgi:hypothetical protein
LLRKKKKTIIKESLYERIKKVATKRYGPKTPGFIKYFEMATKLLMGPKGEVNELRLSLDSM